MRTEYPDSLPAKALSRDGFIIDQRYLREVPFGVKMSDWNGCGWAAAYNFLRLRGAEINWREAASGMRGHTLLFGLLGTDPFGLRRFLRSRGVLTRAALTRRSAVRLAEGADGGILMYWHGRGAHFVAFRRLPDGRSRFFNAVYGAENHVAALDEFIALRSKFPLLLLLVPKN